MVDELKGKGYQVQEVANGEIEMQRVNEQIPDIIFADIWMPVMDGFDLISKLREEPETADVAIVLVTAMAACDAEGKAKELGVKHHFTKPWESWAQDFVLEESRKSSGHGSETRAKCQVYPPNATGHSDSAGRP